MKCVICGSEQFVNAEILWDELIEAWKLSAEEVRYINRQQATHCADCGTSLRGQALASAIMSVVGYTDLFRRFVKGRVSRKHRFLSVNTCATLEKQLGRLRHLTLAEYPEHDVENLAFEDGSFDFVIHSDTLEHVSKPVAGLQECRRVLKPGGVCIYTVPMLVGRLTRSTEGAPPSYHGDPEQRGEDWRVRTEYGSDAWVQPIEAGFQSCAFHCFEHPSAYALICLKALS